MPATSGGTPPEVASISLRSIWLTELKSTKIRSWLALKSSTTARMASASKPVHFSQYRTLTFCGPDAPPHPPKTTARPTARALPSVPVAANCR